jgi:hypothetical protein
MDGASAHTQVKVSVDSPVAAAFKASWATDGVSMASWHLRFMAECAGINRPWPNLPAVGTRRQRRKEVKSLYARLERVLDTKTRYRGRR